MCLSILGTWEGPAWSSVMTIQSVMLSIRSLMSDKPYFNEPGYEGHENSKTHKAASEEYNRRIRYETARVAIKGMLLDENGDSKQMPEVLKGIMKKYFRTNYAKYEAMLERNKGSDNLIDKKLKATYAEIAKALKDLKSKMHPDDEELANSMFASLRDQYVPPPPPPQNSEQEMGIQDLNEFIADAHDEGELEYNEDSD